MGKGKNKKQRARQPQRATTKHVAPKTNPTAFRVLCGCLVILAAGLSIRWYWSQTEADRVALLSQQCEHASREGDWPALEELAREWAGIAPDSYEAWNHAAHAAEEMHDFENAVAYLSNIPDVSPI